LGVDEYDEMTLAYIAEGGHFTVQRLHTELLHRIRRGDFRYTFRSWLMYEELGVPLDYYANFGYVMQRSFKIRVIGMIKMKSLRSI